MSEQAGESDATKTHQATSTRVLRRQEFKDEHVGPKRPPVQIGSYRILRQLGRGGMGSVYLAEPAASCPVPMGRTVAIKVLHRTDIEERRRFEREAAYLQSLRHPGIVRVLDVGEHEGSPFLVMQLIEGKRLDDLVIKQPMAQRQAAEIAVQALEALHVAHLAGILHRDIKPGNIMVDRVGTVKLLDFGLASHMHHETRLTQTGNVVGTPAYMSPEQASGDRDNVTRRSDIYSMGACLYELLTSAQPYTADNSVAMLRRIIDEPLIPPSKIRPDLDRDLETVVLVAMAKDQRDRYPTAEAMAADLRCFLAGTRVRARPVSALTLGTRAAWHHRRVIAGLGLGLFLLLAGTAIAVTHAVQLQRRAAGASGGRQLPPDAWTTEMRVDGAIDDANSGVKIAPYGPLGDGVQLASLPPVKGQARLTATVELLADDAEVAFFLNDRDVGRGYRLVLQAGHDMDRLLLKKEDDVVSSESLGRIPRGKPGWRVCLQRKDATISAQFQGEQRLKYVDLVPIESNSKTAGTYIAYTPGKAVVRQVLLERPLRQPLVSALAVANAKYDDEKWYEAKEEYEDIIRDQPNSPEASEARLRIGLCLEAQKDYENAMGNFLDLARELPSDSPYGLTASFHAWSCALRLNKLDQAERLFTVIRRTQDLQQIMVSIPEDLRTQLLQDYLNRGQDCSETDPRRAINLYITAADLGTYLNNPGQADQGRTCAGDLLVGLGNRDRAMVYYHDAASDLHSSAPQRVKASIKIAEVDRLNGRDEEAMRLYQAAIDDPSDAEWAPLARLYLGDLQLEHGGRAQAMATWSSSTEAQSLFGGIMARLVAGTAPMPPTTDRFFANDAAYFEARLALLTGNEQGYRDGLRTVIRIGPFYDWPTPLAEQLLKQPSPALAPLASAPAATTPSAAPATPAPTPSQAPAPSAPPGAAEHGVPARGRSAPRSRGSAAGGRPARRARPGPAARHGGPERPQAHVLSRRGRGCPGEAARPSRPLRLPSRRRPRDPLPCPRSRH